ncbi:hypothetical protein CHARACLAT_024458 [Characodon lateralis]|uniref:Uncharacterized protein n=1 Tax=Characodon lateralis TaxID=208331 RepID=A0ABU7CT14_9TELE|nr:hypothetical protein [Characodon lateralis]
MLLPCRFCTRMSLICPMNSSRSNQSSQWCPAIRTALWKSGRDTELRGRRRTRLQSVIRPPHRDTADCLINTPTSLLHTAASSVSAARSEPPSSGRRRRKEPLHLVGVPEIHDARNLKMFYSDLGVHWAHRLPELPGYSCCAVDARLVLLRSC